MPDPIFRTILAGCGTMAERWLRIARDHSGLEIVGLLDTRLSAAERARQNFAPEAAVAQDLDFLMEQTGPADLFLNCTNQEAHYKTSALALEKGLHVLTEKPLATEMEEARKLLRLASEKKLYFSVAQNYRFSKGARNVQAYLDSGLIGDLNGIFADFFMGAHFGGFREKMKHVLLIDMAVHHFDLARYFAGKTPLFVSCEEWNPPHSWFEHGANACAHFGFPEGLVFDYRGSWCTEGSSTPWNGVWRFVGKKGTLSWDGANSISTDLVVQRSGVLSKTQLRNLPLHNFPDAENGHASVIHRFIKAIRSGDPADCAIDDNIQTLNMVLAAIASAESGRKVTLQKIPLPEPAEA